MRDRGGGCRPPPRFEPAPARLPRSAGGFVVVDLSLVSVQTSLSSTRTRFPLARASSCASVSVSIFFGSVIILCSVIIFQDALDFPCRADDSVREVVRGARLHFGHYKKELAGAALSQAQLGLGHAYSRAKVKFNPGRADNMIIQSICLLDQVRGDVR